MYLTNFLNAIKKNDKKNYNSKIIGKDSVFQAPEVLEYKRFSVSSEIYSAGMIFLYLLIGDKVYDSSVNDNIPQILKNNSRPLTAGFEFTGDCVFLLSKMLHESPEQRPSLASIIADTEVVIRDWQAELTAKDDPREAELRNSMDFLNTRWADQVQHLQEEGRFPEPARVLHPQFEAQEPQLALHFLHRHQKNIHHDTALQKLFDAREYRRGGQRRPDRQLGAVRGDSGVHQQAA